MTQTVVRRNRRWNATLDVPVHRLGRGWYRTQDGVYDISYHWTHGYWFISYGPEHANNPDAEQDGTTPAGFLEWYPTLWEAREAIASY